MPGNASAATSRIRDALATRGLTLRGWSIARARRLGLDEESSYSMVVMTVKRWAHRRDAPRGAISAGIMADLRAELGPDVVEPLAASSEAPPQPAGRRQPMRAAQ
jgi:hypothetical protein